MPDDSAQRIADLISAPLEALLTSLGAGIGAAQAELDRHSIEIQQRIDEDPVLAQYGLQATWYRIPTTDLELKVAVAMEEVTAASRTPAPIEARGGVVGGRDVGPLPRMWVQPVNARYTNQFNYDVNASSTVRLTVTAVPPPGDVAAGTPTRSEDAIREVAEPHLVRENDAIAGRVTVNYNPGARAWYVVQTTERDNVVTLLALVKIDDVTGSIVRQIGGG